MPDRNCPDCRPAGVNRRQFVSAVGTAALVSGTVPLLSRPLMAAPKADSAAETAVKEFYESLSDEQRALVCLGWDDNRRTKISANWSITKAKIGDFSEAQQETLHKILKGITSEDGYGRFLKQMDADWGSVKRYTVALFGKPGDEQFCFELTGRHLTLRADGNTTSGVAFGGPIVYGHGAKGNSDKNLFSYQTKRANEVFQALDGKQRKQALLARAPSESAVQIRGQEQQLPGIAGGELSSDQQKLVKAVLADIMAPYRKEDVDEVMEIVSSSGGFDKMHIAFYQQGDLDDDGSWDIWRLEHPALVCHFRGAPHVHAYINVQKKS